MSKTAEDVLLAVPEVKYKKNDGTLYVMKERIAFIVENRETVLVSTSFYDVKSKFSVNIRSQFTCNYVFCL